uniref:Uncharacterized protein n=1 Tax=Corvus moneduloides TaxID=1196302 RepID=A0A8C3EA84_CORMO
MSFGCHNMDCTCSERKYEVMQKSGMGFFSYLWECLNCCHNAHFELCICLIMRSNTYVLKMGLHVKCLLEMHCGFFPLWKTLIFLCLQLFIILFASKMELIFFQST